MSRARTLQSTKFADGSLSALHGSHVSAQKTGAKCSCQRAKPVSEHSKNASAARRRARLQRLRLEGGDAGRLYRPLLPALPRRGGHLPGRPRPPDRGLCGAGLRRVHRRLRRLRGHRRHQVAECHEFHFDVDRPHPPRHLPREGLWPRGLLDRDGRRTHFPGHHLPHPHRARQVAGSVRLIERRPQPLFTPPRRSAQRSV